MKKFNFKNPRFLIILVSALVIVLISGLAFGICTKYNKNNTKEAETEYVNKESETKKNDSEKSLVPNIESSTKQTTEEITTESESEENTSEEASTEEITTESESEENTSEEASTEEIVASNNENNYNDNSYSENNYSDNSSSNNENQNNDDSNNSNNENDNSSNSEPSYNPPSNEPSNDTPQEDHIVYKSDGSIDLNESYWIKDLEAMEAIGKSKEYQSLMGKYYNQYGGNNIHFSIQRISTSKSGTYCVYDCSYFCTLFNDKNQRIRFIFNGSEFVEK